MIMMVVVVIIIHRHHHHHHHRITTLPPPLPPNLRFSSIHAQYARTQSLRSPAPHTHSQPNPCSFSQNASSTRTSINSPRIHFNPSTFALFAAIPAIHFDSFRFISIHFDSHHIHQTFRFSVVWLSCALSKCRGESICFVRMPIYKAYKAWEYMQS